MKTIETADKTAAEHKKKIATARAEENNRWKDGERNSIMKNRRQPLQYQCQIQTMKLRLGKDKRKENQRRGDKEEKKEVKGLGGVLVYKVNQRTKGGRASAFTAHKYEKGSTKESVVNQRR